ncbi:MAG: dihydroorotate dehydrogenase electron transfer subunit [bacterium]|nr:dihydroorotate dehydrogenase electron transfer subunit [bacterium]
MPQDITTTVLRNLALGGGNHLVEFDAPEMAREMQPGQFFMIGIPGSETLLRRPFSVCGLPGTFDDGADGALQVLYKVYGTGTALLASLKPGARLSVLGPLGRGFEPPDNAAAQPVFVAGGIGSAPFPALAATLRDKGPAPRMYYGARGEADLPLLDWFREHCADVVVTTEDGSVGERGRVTEPLAALLESSAPDSLHLYACGPDPMLRAVAATAKRYGVICDLALEAHMACGFGVCLGCVVPTHTAGPMGYERVCVEGPVMRAERLAW